MKTIASFILLWMFFAGSFSSALEFTTSTKEVVRDDEGSNVTLKCWTRNQDISLIMLMQITRIYDDISRVTLVEYFNGGKPSFVDKALSNRAKISGSLDFLQEANLTLTFIHPETSDGGHYECVMSFLDSQHSPYTEHATTTFSVIDLSSLKQEVLDLQQEVENLKNRSCSCNVPTQQVVAFTVRIFSRSGLLDLTGGNSSIPFNVVELDTHSAVDVGRFVITVQVTGIYSLQLTLAGVSELQTSILVNHVVKTSLQTQSGQTGSVSYVSKLIKGQEISVSNQLAGTIKSDLCFLSGYLIG